MRLALLLSLLASCSVVPARGFPRFDEREVAVVYAGRDAVQVPASTDDLVVYGLTTEPSPVRETWAQGQRWLHPKGARLTLRVRYRAYARDGQPPAPAALFPGALTIETLAQRSGGGD